MERAWGVADVTTGQKADPATTYRIGSVAKQFTAALVIKLVGAGRLSLTDSVGRHLEGLPSEWIAITVEQLLNHTSGLAGDFRQPNRLTDELRSDSLIAMAARGGLRSAPGTAYPYSNTGYMVLGVLAEKLYGNPYGVVLRDAIARPLRLASLRFCDGTASGASRPGTTGRASARWRLRSSSTRRRASASTPSARRRVTSPGGTRRCTTDACSPRLHTRQ